MPDNSSEITFPEHHAIIDALRKCADALELQGDTTTAEEIYYNIPSIIEYFVDVENVLNRHYDLLRQFEHDSRSYSSYRRTSPSAEWKEFKKDFKKGWKRGKKIGKALKRLF
ncbi:hypothetical protein NKDENANG_00760 [Candidatus Entotheonellaceae bacterium PAL068K]